MLGEKQNSDEFIQECILWIVRMEGPISPYNLHERVHSVVKGDNSRIKRGFRILLDHGEIELDHDLKVIIGESNAGRETD